MDLKASPFKAFLKIAELGSFTKAAQLLHVSQPALSASIREMERQLGFDLFDRTSRRVDLTKEGRAFVANARRLVLETDWLHQKAEEIRTNALRLAVQPHSVFFPDRTQLTDRFLQQYPAANVEILALGHVRIFNALREDDIDLAIVIEPHSVESDGPVRDEDLERLVIRSQPATLLLPEEHALCHRNEIGLEDLRGLPVATISRLHGVALAEMVARALASAGAVLVRPPEADAFSLVRHASDERISAIDLGWFETRSYLRMMMRDLSMISKPVPALGLATQLSVLRRRREQRPAALRFWEHARLSVSHMK
jgi:DNA-binding transcriptional LysR family regulator